MNALPIQIDESFTSEIKNETDEDYHSNSSAIGSTQLRHMLKSPLSFHANFSGTISKKKPSAAMQLGSACHCYLFEHERFVKTYFCSPEFGDLRNKEAKKERDYFLKSLTPGAIPLQKEDWEKVQAIGHSVLRHPDAKALLRRGIAETSHYYRDPVTHIKCKFKPDFLNQSVMALIDLKTTENCTDQSFMKSIWNYRYDFQLAMYGEGVRHIYGEPVKHYMIIAVETEPPYEVAVYKLETMAIEKGFIDYRNCLDTLKECLVKNEWPAYQRRMQPLTLPNWAFKEGDNLK